MPDVPSPSSRLGGPVDPLLILVLVLAATGALAGVVWPTAAPLAVVAVGLVLGLVVGLVIFVLARRRRAASITGTERAGAAPTAPVVVVSGSYGAGHDAAAARIADQVREAGRDVLVLDIVDFYPFQTGRLLKRAYFLQLSACPTSWEHVLNLLSSTSLPARHLSRLVVATLAWLPARRLLAALPGDTALVVSTHPFASAALGRLRRRDELGATAATYLTDPSVHPLWVHAGVDAHLAIYPEAARQALGLRAAGVELVQPLVPDLETIAATRPSRNAVLADLGVSTHHPVVLVVGGSEGVGDLGAAAADVAGTGLATAVVLCGRNDELRAALSRVAGVVALPWQDGLTDLISIADCVVQNAGGFTALEAMALGTPVTSYRCLPGHGSSNAAALAQDGLATWPRDQLGLVEALTDAFSADRNPPADWAERPTLVKALGLASAPVPV